PLVIATGAVTFHGVSLAALTDNATGTETLADGTYTIGSGSPYTFGAVTLEGADVFAQDSTFGAATLAGNTSISTTTGTNAVTFGSTVDAASAGGQGLTVNTAGLTTFSGDVGNGATLASLTLDGPAELIAPLYAATGDQTYQGVVSLAHSGGVTLLAGDDIVFDSNVTSVTSQQNFGLTAKAGRSITIGSGASYLSVAGDLVFDANVSGLLVFPGGGTVNRGTGTGGIVEAAPATTLITTISGAPATHDITLFVGQTANVGDVTVGVVSAQGGSGGSGGTGGKSAGTLAISDGAGTVTAGVLFDSGSANTSTLGGSGGNAGTVTVTDGHIVLSGVGQSTTPTFVTAGSTSTLTIGNGSAINVGGGAASGSGTGNGGNAGAIALNGPVTLDVSSGTQTFELRPGVGSGGGSTGSQGTLDFNGTVDAAAAGVTLKVQGGTTTFTQGVGQSTPFAAVNIASVGNLLDEASIQAATVSVAGNTTFAASGGTVQSTSGETYSGSVTLTDGITILDNGTSTISFLGPVNGPGALDATGSAPVSFNSTVGGTTALASLSVTGATTLNAPSVTTSGGQTYSGAVTLDANTTLTDGSTSGVSFGAVDSDAGGARNLTVSGNASFGGNVGLTHPLAALDVTGTATIDTSFVTTTGSQTYGGALTLGQNTTLNGSAEIFGGTVTGAADTLTVASGTATFDNAVTVSSLNLQAVTFDLSSGSVATTAGQTYSGAVTLGANTTLSDSGGSGITFGNTVSGAHNLDITSGKTIFDNTVGITELITQAVTLDANVTTSAGQDYQGGVLLGGNVTLKDTGGSAIIFASSVDGTHALTVDTAGTATFDGEVGTDVAHLASLNMANASGTTVINTDSIQTTGNQSYGGAVTMAAASTEFVVFNSTATVTFGQTLDGQTSGHGNLTIDANAVFDGNVGATHPVGSIDVEPFDTAGTTDIASLVTIKTTGGQTYDGAATLHGNVSLDTTAGNGWVQILGAISGSGDTLGITTGTTGSNGAAVFRGFNLGGLAVAAAGGEELAAGTYTLSSGTIQNSAGAIELAGSLVFGQDTTFGGAVTLENNTTLTTVSVTNALTFGSTVDDAVAGLESLTTDTTGATTFSGNVGNGAALSSLTVTGPATLGANVTTSGSAGQDYIGAVTLAGNVTLAAGSGKPIVFGSTVTGAYALDIASGTTTLHAGVTTSGGQTYGGAVTLANDATLSDTGAGAITFDSTVNGTHNLIVETAGTTTFDGAVGAVTPLALLTVTGPASFGAAAGSVTTSGAQTYGGTVALAGNLSLDSSAGNGAVSLGPVSGSGDTLTISSGSGSVTLDGVNLAALAITGTGTETLDSGTYAITNGATFGPVDLSGTDTFSASTGTISFGAVTLTSDTTLASTTGSFTFGSTVDSFGSTPYNLDLATAGATIFDGAVGAAHALHALTVGGATTFGGSAGSVTTSGSGGQTYSGAVTLGADTTLAAGGTNPIVFGSTVSGLFLLEVSSGATTLDNTVNIASLQLQAAALDGGSVTTTAGQTYSGNVTLGAATTLSDSDSSGGVTIDGTVGNASSTAEALTINANSLSSSTGMQILLVGNLGTAANPLGAVVLTGHHKTVEGSVYAASFTEDIVPDNITLGGSGGATIQTSAGQSYEDIVVLAGNVSMIDTGGSAIAFSNTVDSTGAHTTDGHGLTVSTTGMTTFGGAVGGTYALGSLDVSTGPATINGGGNVTTSGGQTYGGAVTLGATLVTLTDNAGGAITFGGTVDAASVGGESLTVNTTGLTSFNGEVGVVSAALNVLTVSGPTSIGTDQIVTTGGQTYGGAVTLAANTTLTDPTFVDFVSTVDSSHTGSASDGHNLTVSGDASFGGAVGTAYALGSLDVTSSSTFNGGPIVTSSGQTYKGPVTLNASATLTDTGGSAITFEDTIYASNNASLTVATTGSTTFDWVVGSSALPLGSLSVTEGATTFGSSVGTVTTTGGQTYSGAVVLAGSTTLISTTSGAIDFQGTVDGGFALTTNTSDFTTFAGSVGGTAPLASLEVSGTVSIGASLINTLGDQNYDFGLVKTGSNDTLLEASGTGADIEILFTRPNFVTSYNSSGQLNLLASRDIVIEGAVQNDGSGAVNVVAGWDGTTGLSGSTVTFSQIAANPSSFGHGGSGNSGDVTIDGSGTFAAIGSAGGATNIAGRNVFVEGNTHGAQIGYHGAGNAPITVLATTDVTLTGGGSSGAYAQIGHGGFGVGTGATGAVTLGGDITVTAGGAVFVEGGSTDDTYAQIGHGGDGAFAGATLTSLSLGGSIGVTAVGDVSLAGSDGQDAYAQIGHGGFEFASGATIGGTAGMTGAISVASSNGSVSLAAGFGSGFSYAQIGHGGAAAFYNASAGDLTVNGDITVTAANGNVELDAGGVNAGYAQIGHGGAGFGGAYNFGGLSGNNASFNDVTLSGNITVQATNTLGTSGGVFLTGGSGSEAYAQIGHGGAYAFAGDSSLNNGGPVSLASLTLGGSGETITVAGDNGIGLSGGSSTGAYAQIGHGGYSFAFGATVTNAVTVGSAIDVTANSGDIDVTGGSDNETYAQIGLGGYSLGYGLSGTTISGAISVVSSGGGVSLSGGTGGENAYAQIGHGGAQAFSYDFNAGAIIIDGAITVSAQGTTGNVSLVGNGSCGCGGDYAQIGHGGYEFGYQLSAASVELTGAISVNSSNGGVNLSGGNGSDSYAQIGHGGDSAFSNASITGDLTVGSLTLGDTLGDIAVTAGNGDIGLSGGGGNGAYAQIGHGGYSFANGATVSGGVSLGGTIVVAGQDVTLAYGSGFDAYAQIGHGDGSGNGAGGADAQGNIDVRATDILSISGGATIGHVVGGTVSGGDIYLAASQVISDGVSDTLNGGDSLSASLINDLAGGEAVLAVNDALTVNAFSYTGSNGNTLGLFSQNGIIVNGITNGGPGGVVLVGDWDGASGIPATPGATAFDLTAATAGIAFAWINGPVTVTAATLDSGGNINFTGGALSLLGDDTVTSTFNTSSGTISFGAIVGPGSGTGENLDIGIATGTVNFTDQVGTLANPFGILSVGGTTGTMTISNGVEVYVSSAAIDIPGGTANFGTTLNANPGPITLTLANVSGNEVGPVVFLSVPGGTLNGLPISILLGGGGSLNLGNVADDSSLQIGGPIDSALADSNESLGLNTINPTAGCGDGSDPSQGCETPTYTYANDFIQGKKP
ncbi:MAG TPA: hypothetical protein VFC38_06175, partial [Stellaceae bacterium]|nr:hypothetical protein [Stellaceae bacterium]